MIVLYPDKINSGTLPQENSGPEQSSKTKPFQSIGKCRKVRKKYRIPYSSQRITFTNKINFVLKNINGS